MEQNVSNTLSFQEIGSVGQSTPEEIESSRILETMKMQPQEHGDVDSEFERGFQMFETTFSVGLLVEVSVKRLELLKQAG